MFDGDRRVQIALNELTLASGVFIVINDPTRKCRRIEKPQQFQSQTETRIKISITRSKQFHRMVVKVKVKVY